MAGAGRKVDNQVNMHRDGNGGLTIDQMLGEASQSDIFGLNYVDLLTRLQSDLVPTAGINGVPVDIGSSSIPDGSTLTYDAASGAYVQSTPTTPWGRVTGVSNTFPVNTAGTPINWVAGNVTTGNGMVSTGQDFIVPEAGEYEIHSALTLVPFAPIAAGGIQIYLQVSTNAGSTWTDINPGTDVEPLVSGVTETYATTHLTDIVTLAAGEYIRTVCSVIGTVASGALTANGGKSFIYKIA